MKGLLLYIPLYRGLQTFHLSPLEAELNSWKAELNCISRTYQQFVVRNIKLKRREDELQLNINELETKEAELKRIVSEFKQQLSELRENKEDSYNLDLEIKQEEVNFTNELFNTQSKRRVAEMAYGQDDVSQ
jgi:chromosome segregation ATPase